MRQFSKKNFFFIKITNQKIEHFEIQPLAGEEN